jgi:hypothetical protein
MIFKMLLIIPIASQKNAIYILNSEKIIFKQGFSKKSNVKKRNL